MSKAFRWLIVGAGVIAHRVAEEIVASGRHAVTGVTSKAGAEEFVSRFGGAAYGDLRSALAMGGYDGVYAATPHSAHASVIRDCIEFGAPVLCEKPFTVNARQAEALFDAAAKKGVYLCEGMWTRFLPVTERVRVWAATRIGTVRTLKAKFCYPYRFSGFTDRVVDPAAAGGALLDAGVYCVHYAQMLLGDPVSVRVAACKKGPTGVDVYDKIELDYASGAQAVLECGVDRVSLCGATVSGDEGRIKVPVFFKPTRAALRTAAGTERADGERGFLYEFDAAAEDIRAGRRESAVNPHRATLSVLRTLDSLRAQAGVAYAEKLEAIPEI